jgi:hypothetical protein
MAEKSSNAPFDTNPNPLIPNEIQLPKQQNIFSASRHKNRPSSQPLGNKSDPLKKP